MQTFLPYPSFTDSAYTLDRARLGKQRVENLQILMALIGEESGWKNHPAVRMWRGHEHALLAYQSAICLEWCGRGYRDTCLTKSFALFHIETIDEVREIRAQRLSLPPWLGDEDFHRSHRSNLLRKLPAHYGRFFSDPDDLDYVWPVPADLPTVDD